MANLISGSKQYIVFQLVSITRMMRRDWAEWILKKVNRNLDRATAWFYDHKNDDEYKDGLETEDEFNKVQGICLF